MAFKAAWLFGREAELTFRPDYENDQNGDSEMFVGFNPWLTYRSGAPSISNVAPPSISSTGVVGSDAEGTTGEWSATPDSVAQQWQFFDAFDNGWYDIDGEAGLDYEGIDAAYNLTFIRLKETATLGGATAVAYSNEIAVTYAAPAITDPGSVSGGTTIGSTLVHSGLTYTGTATTILRRWLADGVAIPGVVSSSFFVADGSGLDGADISVEVTVGNSGGADTDETAAVTLTYAAPAAGADVDWSEAEGTGTQSIDLRSSFSVAGDDDLSGVTWSIQSGGGANYSISGGILSVNTGGPTGGGTGPLTDHAIVVRVTNSGGHADLTATLDVTERTLGSNLVSNGDFPSTTTGWSAANSATLSVVSGAMRNTAGASNSQARQSNIAVTSGAYYRIKVKLVGGTGTGTVRVGTAAGGTQYGSITTSSPQLPDGRYYMDVLTTTTGVYLSANVASSGTYADFDDIELLPFATASTPAAMTSGLWDASSAGAVTGTDLSVTISTAPSDGGSAITKYQYRLNSSAWAEFSPALTTPGTRTVVCPTWETDVSLEVRAVNANGGGGPSDIKVRKPQFSSTCRFIAASGGNDAASGTFAAPWSTSAKAAATLTAGQTSYFRPGNYSAFTVGNSGTSGNFITYATLPGEEHQAVFTGGDGIRSVGKDYIRLRGLRVFSVNGDGIRFLGQSGKVTGNIEILDCQVDTTTNAGIYIAGRQMGTSPAAAEWRMNGVLVEDCDITNTNFDTGGNECISLGGGTENFVIRRCVVHDSQQFGIDCKLGARNGVIEDCHVFNIEKSGIYLDAACRPMSNIIVRRCLVHDNGTVGLSHRREATRGASDGHLEVVSDIVFENNVVYRNGNYGFLADKYTNDNLSCAWTGVEVRFNTFFDNGGVDQVRIIGIDSVAAGWALVGNIIYDPGDATPINVTITGITNSDNRTTNPNFVSTTSGAEDLRLTASINVSGSAAAYTPATDILGNARGNPADFGAYEYVA